MPSLPGRRLPSWLFFIFAGRSLEKPFDKFFFFSQRRLIFGVYDATIIFFFQVTQEEPLSFVVLKICLSEGRGYEEQTENTEARGPRVCGQGNERQDV